MAGNNREETQRPGYALKEIMKRMTGYKDYGWAWSKEEFEEMARRVKEIELRNMTGTWAGIDKEEEKNMV